TLLKAEREVLVSLIRRRVDERIPVPYLTRTAWFARLPFYIDKRALIPRSPFAEVVEAGFERYWNADASPPNQILELCTGSGCIAILCALRYPDAHVVATDISEDALNVARINVARHRVPVTLTHGDLFASVTERFDVIVANPPYVAEADWAVSPAEFHQEPKLALTAGEDGLELVRRILMLAPNYLTENGLLFVEVGDSQPYFEEIFPSCPVMWIPLERGGSGVFVIHREDLAAYLETGEIA
ncbi:MAG: 50S ribosomal protein L3 N(5)-glutamine methyltransferase, partial [Gammaproteobacteria bacterium]